MTDEKTAQRLQYSIRSQIYQMPLAPFTLLEQKAIADVLQHQRCFSPIPPNTATTATSTELNIALDGSGAMEIARQILPAHGGCMSAAMVTAATSAIGCRIIHNHPNQGSLSSSDWNVLANHLGMEMTSVNSRGTTFRGKVIQLGAFSDWYLETQKAYDFVSGELQKMITALYSQSLWAEADFALENDWLVGRAIGERLQQKGYAEFECISAASDTTVISSAHGQRLAGLLGQWCTTAIP